MTLSLQWSISRNKPQLCHGHGLAFPWIPGPEPGIQHWLSAFLRGGAFSGWTVGKTDFCQLDKRASTNILSRNMQKHVKTIQSLSAFQRSSGNFKQHNSDIMIRSTHTSAFPSASPWRQETLHKSPPLQRGPPSKYRDSSGTGQNTKSQQTAARTCRLVMTWQSH